MEPNIKINSEENNNLLFTMTNINHSLANSLRRLILSEIPTFVFRTFPHNESKVDIITNTTRLNNEIIKQRLGCIPIHIDDNDFPYQEYVVEVNKQNDTDTIQLLTTEDFMVKNISTDKYLSANAVKEIFPPDLITGDYIPITRLRPPLSDNIQGEHIQFNAFFDQETAKHDGMYNVVSTCAYGATMDLVKANDIWNDKKKELVKTDISEEDVAFQKANWFLLDAKRITVPNSFDFIIESVGVFSNFKIVNKACEIMIQKCNNFISMLEKGDIEIEKTENTTISNEFTITLKNEDYTLGNALNYFLYEKYYLGDKSISFVGFSVPHPHIPNGIIRIAFENVTDDNQLVLQYLTNSALDVITTFTNIQNKFKD
jgi:DNA-directed RNA polymerase II subunit RPB3